MHVVDFVLLKILDEMMLLLVLTVEMHERLKHDEFFYDNKYQIVIRFE